MTTIIILSVVAILVLIGATQRKKIALLIKSEVNEVVTNKLSAPKVLKLRIKEAKENALKLVDQAAELKALEEDQGKLINDLEVKYKDAIVKAKKAKDDGEEEKSMSNLTLAKSLKKQIDLATQNKETAEKTRVSLEGKITKIKTTVQMQRIELVGIEARKNTNDVLKSVSLTTVNGDSIDDSLTECSNNVAKEEVKLEYQLAQEEDNDDEYSEEIKKEYENL